MSRQLSLEGLSQYIADNIEQIAAVRREVEEIQVGFNSAYVEWKAEHDASVERLTEALGNRLAEVGPGLKTWIEERTVEEGHLVAQRREELRDRLVPDTQAETDLTLEEGQRLTKELRELNPVLNEPEEKLKAQRAALEEELGQLNDQIRRLSGGLGVVINFFKITKLDRQRQRAIGKLEAIQQELKEVREEWQTFELDTQDEQQSLQARWQELTLRLARLQGELDYLDDEASREALALKRAVRYTIDNLKEPVACHVPDLRLELDAMVELNIQTDEYHEGLGSVSSLLSLLDGVTEGLNRFRESVQGLISEQNMHSAYLPKLSVIVPGEVLTFHENWHGMRQRVQDDRRLCVYPKEFSAAVRPVIEEDMSQARIAAMFEGLGQALKRATQGWR